MSSLFFWFVYFTLDDVYKVKAVFNNGPRQDNRTTPNSWQTALASNHFKIVIHNNKYNTFFKQNLFAQNCAESSISLALDFRFRFRMVY